jgi:hypothetical protein
MQNDLDSIARSYRPERRMTMDECVRQLVSNTNDQNYLFKIDQLISTNFGNGVYSISFHPPAHTSNTILVFIESSTNTFTFEQIQKLAQLEHPDYDAIENRPNPPIVALTVAIPTDPPEVRNCFCLILEIQFVRHRVRESPMIREGSRIRESVQRGRESMVRESPMTNRYITDSPSHVYNNTNSFDPFVQEDVAPYSPPKIIPRRNHSKSPKRRSKRISTKPDEKGFVRSVLGF